MLKNFNTAFTENSKDIWLTPPHIIKSLGEFDLDPCAAINQPWSTAKKMITLPTNGLISDWSGRVWCNPPYGRETFKWAERCAEHGNATMLIFARTETLGFHSEIWEKAHSLFFFKRRLKFYHVNGKEGGTANAPSLLVSYDYKNSIAIHLSKIAGFIEGKQINLSVTGDHYE